MLKSILSGALKGFEDGISQELTYLGLSNLKLEFRDWLICLQHRARR